MDADKILIATLYALGSSGPFQSWRTNYLDQLDADKVLIATLDVKTYHPNEICLKVQEGKIKVDGKHHSEEVCGYDSREFHRTYDLPESVDPSTVSSRVSPDGVLYIEAYKTPPKEYETTGMHG
jgi:HSP20 family molecular chaperone IbpA